MTDSLWGDDFAPVSTEKTAKILNKMKSPKSSTPKRGSSKVSLQEQLSIIRANVLRILGVYKDNTQVIYTREDLHSYISAAIENGIIAVDTETNNSLDPITCTLMGPCIYTPGQKNAYIPLNHVDPVTLERLPNQLTEEDVKEEFLRLVNTKILMHNAKFDYQVIKCTTGVQLKVYWDTMLGARMINENEKRAGLKQQYIEKIDPTIEKYSIDHLFENVEYAVVEPEIFALYAATDAFMTYKLYEWQKRQFESPGNERLFDVFLNVEMQVMEVAAEMELTGICIDSEYAERLSAKYHKKLDELNLEIDQELSKYSDMIAKWRLTDEANYKPEKIDPKTGEKKFGKSKSEQLADPVALTSTTQLAILIYDILKHPPVDKESPRGTGEDILMKIDIPLSNLIVKQRGLLKLINTYIDKLPQCVNEKSGRLHAHFNQIGADTGRFSSSDPNLQNIPSHEKSIRMLFTASPGHVLVGSDFSQQEPRLLANYSKDENMIGAYKAGKDLYATIATQIHHNDYWDNMEFTDETKTVPNPEGKKRRSAVKSLLLGIMYGMGPASLAESINGTVQDAQKIIDDFYAGFPKVKKWIDETYTFAKQNGYVEDLWGRRRRLPDIQLPKYTITKINGSAMEFNPILGCLGLYGEQSDPLVDVYRKKLDAARGKKDVENITAAAFKDGITIRNNGYFISQAERQCVNSRVQGGAATMSKKAMINVYRDPVLKELGFKLMIAVHDELIGECPAENADAVADRLCEVMKHSALPECTVPFKCDPTIESSWYYTDYGDTLRAEYSKLLAKNPDTAFSVLCESHTECTIEQIENMIKQ